MCRRIRVLLQGVWTTLLEIWFGLDGLLWAPSNAGYPTVSRQELEFTELKQKPIP